MITIQKALADLNSVIKDFNKLAEQTGFAEFREMRYIKMDYDNAEQVFIAREIYNVMEKIDDMLQRITYINQPIIETTTIHLNSNGRYETATGHEYTCGSSIECLLIGEYGNQEWVWASVEHNGSYYITFYGNPPLKDGMTVRIRG